MVWSPHRLCLLKAKKYIYYDSQTHKIWPSLILLPLAMWMIRVWDPLQRPHLLPLLFKSTNHIGIILSSLQLWATFHTKEKRGCQHAFYSLPKKYVFSYAIFPRASTGKYSGEKQTDDSSLWIKITAARASLMHNTSALGTDLFCPLKKLYYELCIFILFTHKWVHITQYSYMKFSTSSQVV